ncbi:hypothetical protein [Natrinema sp. CBA1119]|uniref:hypothetical protein n=1 Tax=Natrinema sp. CBA1119 TaxID=1608465 RepID=UPI001145C694|nr:hypothetical protein [Natrinema sp. CBA1119]
MARTIVAHGSRRQLVDDHERTLNGQDDGASGRAMVVFILISFSVAERNSLVDPKTSSAESTVVVHGDEPYQ